MFLRLLAIETRKTLMHPALWIGLGGLGFGGDDLTGIVVGGLGVEYPSVGFASACAREQAAFHHQVLFDREETIEAQFRLADNVLRPGDSVFITTAKDIYDNLNTGVKIVFRFP